MPFYVNIVKLGFEEAICGHVTSLPVLSGYLTQVILPKYSVRLTAMSICR